MRRLSAVLAAALLVAIAAVLPASAQQPTAQVTATVSNEFPTALRFEIEATADSPIAEVQLNYSVIGRGSSAVARPDLATPSTSIALDVELEVNSQSGYIPVGSEFLYFWQVTLEDGSVTLSEEQTFLFLPPEPDWQTVENDFMTVYYHGDREAQANAYLQAAEATLVEVGSLLKVELEQLPVRVMLFANEDELGAARPGRGESFDAAVTTCGTKVEEDIVFVIPVSCGTGDPTDTLRHEFGHILNGAAGDSALSSLPSWLDEGMAVLAQTEPGQNYTGALQSAVARDDLIPFVEMATASNDPRQVNLFYGQSFAMVAYLIDFHGPDALADLFATIQGGRRFDQALLDVYGFSVADFQAGFREVLGLDRFGPAPPPAVEPTQPALDTTTDDDPDPTATTEPEASTQSSDDGDDGISGTTLGIAGGAVALALLAAFFFLMSQMMKNRRENAIAAHRRPPVPPPMNDDDIWGPPAG